MSHSSGLTRLLAAFFLVIWYSSGIVCASGQGTIDPYSGKPCYLCHRSKVSGLHVHGALAGNRCTPCHKLSNGNHLAEHRFSEVTDRTARLCYACHDQSLVKEDKAGQATGFCDGNKNLHFLHAQLSLIPCLACHQVHAGSQNHLINTTGVIGKEKMTITYRATSAGGNCISSCHDPVDYVRK